MRIIDVARRVGVSADWLRRLERTGRIPPAQRDWNGHRRYTEEEVEQIRLALYGKQRLVGR